MDEDDPSSYLIPKKLSLNKTFQEISPNEKEYNSLDILSKKKYSHDIFHSDRKPSIEESISTVFFRPVHHGSLKSSIFCMICVTLGTGMLPIPHLFSSNGLILTFILYFFFLFSNI